MLKAFSRIMIAITLSTFGHLALISDRTVSAENYGTRLTNEAIENYLVNSFVAAAAGKDESLIAAKKGGNKGGKGGNGGKGGKGGGNNVAKVVGTYTGTFLLTKQEGPDLDDCTSEASIPDYQIIVTAAGKKVNATVSKQYLYLPQTITGGTVGKNSFKLTEGGGVIEVKLYTFTATNITDTSANITFKQETKKRAPDGKLKFLDCAVTFSGVFARTQ